MTSVTNEQTRAAIYTRLSLAVMGDTTKVEDQARICRELCAARGWHVHDVYCDNSKSAWQRNRKRKDWDRMLTDVESGKLNAIMIYHGDRLVRQPFDLETLINLADGKGIKLASPTGTRDLENGDDLFILRIEVAAACRESWSTSRRKKAQYERMRRQGLIRPGGGGGRAFGFETDGVTHRPDEIAVIREAAAAVIGGSSVRSVVAELNERGVRTTAGNVMRQGSFQRTLLLPRMAGLMPDGESAAAWEPVLDRGTWETLRALKGMRQNAGAGKGAAYLLSGIARCGGCGHVLWSAYAANENSYRCPPQDGGCGKVRRNRILLDAFITEAVVAQLARTDNPAGRAPEAPGLAAEFATLTTARAELEEVLADYTRGNVRALLERRDRMDERLAELRGLAGDDARARLRAGHAGISYEEFTGEPLSVQRSLADACFSIVVLPASRRGPGFRKEDIRLIPR